MTSIVGACQGHNKQVQKEGARKKVPIYSKGLVFIGTESGQPCDRHVPKSLALQYITNKEYINIKLHKKDIVHA